MQGVLAALGHPWWALSLVSDRRVQLKHKVLQPSLPVVVPESIVNRFRSSFKKLLPLLAHWIHLVARPL